ncbi:MAG TPA: dihydrolipoamide succinyltransferase, partial [Octadecabacter sp.]|nr:dihydrolipoamide succinyltransferase [Octadecabacter sp.]
MMTEVRVPTLGESVTEATVATWFKKPGDTVAQDEMLCELETDKVTVEVPAPAAGTLSEIVAAEGDTVGVDALLAQISAGGEATPTKAAPAPQAQEAAPVSGGNEMEIMVPTLGESVTEATVSTWFKKPGEAFVADEMLCELETDKVSVEVPAPAAGVLTTVLAEEGATVEAGGKLAIMSTDASAAPAPAAAAAAAPTPAASGSKDVENAPSAKKLMAENNLTDVTGTGKDGRVMKEDVLNALAAPAPATVAAAPPRAPVAADQASREERVKMTRLRQT